MVLHRVILFSGLSVLVACGGQANDPLNDAPSQPIFQSDSVRLSDNDFVIYQGPDQIDLSLPDFVDGSAQHNSADQSYVAFSGGEVLVVAGEKNRQHFLAIAGHMAPLFSYDRVVFDAKINVVQGAYASQFPIALTINFGWDVPRLLGGDLQYGIDVSGQVTSDGDITGRVDRFGNTANLIGAVGVSTIDGTAQLAAAFSSDQFYGIVYGAQK